MTVRQPRGVLVALPLVLTLTGCSTGQPQKQYLDALKSDPLATWMPEQGRLAFEGTDEARLGSTTHKQQPARIIRRIELPDEQSRARAWRDGVSFAREHGCARAVAPDCRDRAPTVIPRRYSSDLPPTTWPE